MLLLRLTKVSNQWKAEVNKNGLKSKNLWIKNNEMLRLRYNNFSRKKETLRLSNYDLLKKNEMLRLSDKNLMKLSD